MTHKNNELIIVSMSLTTGGAERVMSELMDRWKEYASVTLVELKGDGYIETYDIPPEVNRITLQKASSNKMIKYCSFFVRVVRILREHPNAVVLAFNQSVIYLLGMARLFTSNKIVLAERNDPDSAPDSRIMRKVRDGCFELADLCVFQTEDAKKHFSKRVQKKSVVIPNAINPNLPERYIGERRKTVIAMCRLHNQKNIPMMIEAFKSFLQEWPEYTLEIYGRGPDEQELTELIDKEGLSKKVFLKGFSQNVYEVMKDCSMYVSSSNYEGISNSMLEALAMGLPCVCTDCPVGGARMAIQSGVNGILTPVGDSEAMSKAMKKIAGDPVFAQKISDNAYRIRTRFSMDVIGEQWLTAMGDIR